MIQRTMIATFPPDVVRRWLQDGALAPGKSWPMYLVMDLIAAGLLVIEDPELAREYRDWIEARSLGPRPPPPPAS
jgi:hypothetical protein